MTLTEQDKKEFLEKFRIAEPEFSFHYQHNPVHALWSHNHDRVLDWIEALIAKRVEEALIEEVKKIKRTLAKKGILYIHPLVDNKLLGRKVDAMIVEEL